MTRLLSCASLLALALTGAPASAGDVTVEVGHNRLEPKEVTIQVGDTVTFHNQDQMPGGHTIVADEGAFKSPGLAKDQRWSHTFDAAGTYEYRIEEHPSAQGMIVVEE